MAEKSSIEWTDATWNPVTGCSRVSEGCRHCYAERLSARFGEVKNSKFRGMAMMTTSGPRWTGNVFCHEDALGEPLRWRRPRRIFVNSVSDTFHPKVPFEFLGRMFAVMALCPQHTFQVLTKRPGRAYEYFAQLRDRDMSNCPQDADGAEMAAFIERNEIELPGLRRHDGVEFYGIDRRLLARPLPNVWLGVSVEDQGAAESRIPWLLKCPAAVRFLSCEPLLGPVDLDCIAWSGLIQPSVPEDNVSDGFDALRWHTEEGPSHINWVIAGGESGPGSRPCHPDWVRGIRDQCVAAGVPFFFKQWGDWLPFSQARGEHMDAISRSTIAGHQTYFGKRIVQGPQGPITGTTPGIRPEQINWLGKKTAGRLLDGRTWDEMPKGHFATDERG